MIGNNIFMTVSLLHPLDKPFDVSGERNRHIINPFSAGIDFRRQIRIVDPRTQRVKHF